MKPRVLNVVLSHQRAAQVEKTAAWWTRLVPAEDLLFVLTGRREDFEAVTHARKVFVSDARLRTRDHQRERQSYTAVLAAAARWLREGTAGDPAPFTHVHFAEFDHLPLAADLNARQLTALEAEGADLLGFGLRRVDNTSHPHFLYHEAQPGFLAFWQRLSRRRGDRDVVLSQLGTGAFWTRAAFEAVAAVGEPFPVYLELWLPTLAHHLGFRVRPFRHPDATSYVRHLGDQGAGLEHARAAGAWTIHPVKTLWD